jgi:hypothetical protein
MGKKKKVREKIIISREELLRIARQIRREEWVEEGAYDGRLRPQVHTDKKKDGDKYRCREKIRWDD